MVEMWKIIDNYPEYQVSTYGNVKRTQTDKILKPIFNVRGYKYVNLYNEGKTKHKQIHKLVSEAFCENLNNYKIVDHIDREKSNNHYTNLRFCTQQENCFNKSKRTDNTSGISGVYFDKRSNTWLANKFIHIGYFKTFEQAKEARLKKEKELFGEFSPNN